jgi:hypothetical protein
MKIIDIFLESDQEEILTPEQRKFILSILDRYLERGGIIIALYDINDLGLNVHILPELAEILDNHKLILIKAMLNNLRYGEEGFSAVEQTLSRLEHTGINWPELKIIRRSLDAEVTKTKQIRESSIFDIDSKKYIASVMDPIIKLPNAEWFDPSAACNSIINLYGFGGFTPNQIKEIILPYKKQIVDYFNINLIHYKDQRSQLDWLIFIDTIEIFKEHANTIWPEMLDILDKGKKQIMLILLTFMKDLHFDTVNSILKQLIYIDVKWPELGIIQNSIDADRKQQMNESIPKYYKQNNGSDLIRRLDRLLRDEFDRFKDNEYNTPDEAAYNLILIGLTNSDIPNSSNIFDKYKQTIMVGMLRTIADPEWIRYSVDIPINDGLQAMIAGAKKLGLDWPELGIIQNSIDVDCKQQINETEWESSEVIDQLRNLLNGKFNKFDKDENVYYDEIAYMLTLLNKAHGNVPNCTDIIQRYKQIIIKSMLYTIADPSLIGYVVSGDINDGLLAMIAGAKRFGVNGPEIDIMEKSIRHDATNH